MSLIARGFQTRSPSSKEARQLAEDLYQRIMVERDPTAVVELQALADASERGDMAVEVLDTDEVSRRGYFSRALGWLGLSH